MVGLSATIYVSAFALFRGYVGGGGDYFILIPLVAFAWLYGVKGGLILGLFSHPLNVSLAFMLGHEVGRADFRLEKIAAWAFALAIGVLVGYLADLNRKYQRALREVKVLNSLLPMCSACKKIRDDEGHWEQVDVYLRDHADVLVSHGLCPSCSETVYAELAEASDG